MEFPYLICAALVLASYIVGSLPFGFWISKSLGVDIRNQGSGNIGATNVLRTLGRKVGITVLILDISKGFLPVLIGSIIIFNQLPDSMLDIEEIEGTIYVLLAIGAILGHNYTFWLGFKGGKGIATSAGAIMPFLPEVLIGSLFVWILFFFLSRYVAIASIAAAFSIPILTISLDHNYLFPNINSSWPVISFGIIASIMAIWRHRSNIQRLIKGEEDQFERKIKNKA
ncbi:MAG: glycerol-3-phosphate 1-O-acyltransferase PlsY [Verrucomicrobiota bacterium]|nr:glycerol-3-phosphate 1-O-acyltransferase PlsY [Verrucomicrobiota bacterium]MEC9327743.1 glycerol-3-phosphate 1-O-acyltransferase PlsY [Verrucomicrobiota bacterium]